jgi:radical SAM superfamily enzyme YgiQ (UPF0313 family)
MVYKQGPSYRVRKVQAIVQDLEQAREVYGSSVRSIFFPAGNSIAMPPRNLARICEEARRIFPELERITVYGSAQFIRKKGLQHLHRLRQAGLSRIHVGLESGNDQVLDWVRKGSDRQTQIQAGQMLKQAEIQNSSYVVLGLGGKGWTRQHAQDTATALNQIQPEYVRLRTLLPKVNTQLLSQIQKGEFQLLSPHEVLQETRLLISGLECSCQLLSDHYTNYLNLAGELPQDKNRLLQEIDQALELDESCFRPIFVGTQ